MNQVQWIYVKWLNSHRKWCLRNTVHAGSEVYARTMNTWEKAKKSILIQNTDHANVDTVTKNVPKQ